jgi:hypothetical protein
MDAKPTSNQENDFGLWLDAALRARNDAEPRMGLEDRVLARLASEPQGKALLRWPVLVAIAALLVIAGGVTVLYRRPVVTDIAHRAPATNVQPKSNFPTQKASGSHQIAAIRRPSQVRRASACCVAAKAHRDAEQAETLPKLAQFPSPRPQTTQEQMLMRLAARRDSYDTAVLASHSEWSELSVPEINVDPMAGTPPDSIPQR